MASTLQVILHSDVSNLGKSGDLVKVRPGYARNFLIPRGFAVAATKAELHQLEHQKNVALARYENMKKEATAMAEKLASVSIQIKHAAGDENRLFGAVTSKEIALSLKSAGYDIDRKAILLDEPIKHLGQYDVSVKLFSQMTATIKVEVVKK